MNDDSNNLLAGLNELRASGPRGIYAPGNDKHLLQARITQTDAATLKLSGIMAHLLTGRSTPQSILIRRMIETYADHLLSTLKNPSKAAGERDAIEALRKRQQRSAGDA